MGKYWPIVAVPVAIWVATKIVWFISGALTSVGLIVFIVATAAYFAYFRRKG